jgi:hypothetical protein
VSNLDPTTHTLACATLAVLFRRDFKELVRQHLAAAEGLDLSHVRTYMHEAADVYSVDVGEVSETLWFQAALGSVGFPRDRISLVEALAVPGATKVRCSGEILFTKRGDQWVAEILHKEIP